MSVRILFGEYARRKAHPYVANHVSKSLQYFQNPKMEKILDMVRSFSPEWETELRARTEGEIKSAIDSIVQNRHLIAHGQNVGMTLVTIKEYYRQAIILIDMIEEKCS